VLQYQEVMDVGGQFHWVQWLGVTLDVILLEDNMRKSWEDKIFHQKLMKKLGYKPRRRKDSQQWWESPFIDYDTPRQKYY